MGLGLGRHAARALACLLFLMATLRPLGAQDPEAAANQKKARATLDAMVEALGGQRWLTLTSTMQQGRTSGFYLGKPTGMTSEFYEIQKFPDQTRVELGKKRDVFEIISGDQAWEITYKGKRELPKEQIQDLIRRRDHSIQTAMRVWLNDPGRSSFITGKTWSNAIWPIKRPSLVQRMTASPSRAMPKRTCPCGGPGSGAIPSTTTRIPTRKSMTTTISLRAFPPPTPLPATTTTT